MPNAFPGLSAAEWEDINAAVLEAMGFVLMPVIFHEPNAEAELDDLYGETEAGEVEYDDLATIGASVRYRPSKERLTNFGLKAEAEVLLFIPRGEILRWEATNARSFLPEEAGWEVTSLGKTFNVFEVRTDPLPVGDGTTSDYIGMVVTGYKER